MTCWMFDDFFSFSGQREVGEEIEREEEVFQLSDNASRFLDSWKSCVQP